MAAASGSLILGSPIICKICKNNVAKNFLECEKCKSIFHQSCARLSKGVKVISDTLINCCGVESCDANSEAFFDAMKSLSVDSKMDVTIFTYIIKQKDMLIHELQDKIKILNEHVEMLKKFNTFQTCEKEQNVMKPNVEAKNFSYKNFDRQLSVNKPVDKVGSQKQLNVLSDAKEQKVKGNEPSVQINKNRKQLSAELLNVESKLKCNQLINLTHDTQIDLPSCSNDKPPDITENEWKEVNYSKPPSRKRRMIVGSNKHSSIKGVRKLAYLHVSRVDQATSAVDLEELLRKSFSEVNCESVKPRYPNLYSSFKVTIFEENFRKAMDPTIWPDGACISKFFLKRPPIQLAE